MPKAPPLHRPKTLVGVKRAAKRDKAAKRRIVEPGQGRFYKTALWRKIREQVLNNEPLCRECRKHGRITIATDVDHITPISAGGSLTDISNLQPLCKKCHSRKTAYETLHRDFEKENPTGEGVV